MKDSLVHGKQSEQHVCCSVVTPSGCLIRCLCGNLFSPVNSPDVEVCPECQHAFSPGFIYQVEVTSRRSGMTLGIHHDEQAGTDLEAMVFGTVAARFGSECDSGCMWKVRSFEKAYFDVEIEES